jgi:hypothetical protein
MKTLRQFISENRFQESVIKDPSPEQLKTLARNSVSPGDEHGAARFVIDKQGNMRAGDAFKHTHYDLDPTHVIRGLCFSTGLVKVAMDIRLLVPMIILRRTIPP